MDARRWPRCPPVVVPGRSRCRHRKPRPNPSGRRWRRPSRDCYIAAWGRWRPRTPGEVDPVDPKKSACSAVCQKARMGMDQRRLHHDPGTLFIPNPSFFLCLPGYLGVYQDTVWFDTLCHIKNHLPDVYVNGVPIKTAISR